MSAITRSPDCSRRRIARVIYGELALIEVSWIGIREVSYREDERVSRVGMRIAVEEVCMIAEEEEERVNIIKGRMMINATRHIKESILFDIFFALIHIKSSYSHNLYRLCEYGRQSFVESI